MAVVKIKRVAHNDRHMWSAEDKINLLEYMRAGVAIDRFEKPNATEFYKHFLKDQPNIKVTAKVVRDQVRALKIKYIDSVMFKKQAAEGHLENESVNEAEINEYIARHCPYFDLLDEIYHDQALDSTINVRPSNTSQSLFRPQTKIVKAIKRKHSSILDSHEIAEQFSSSPSSSNFSPSTDLEAKRLHVEEKRLEFELEKLKIEQQMQKEKNAHELKMLEMKLQHELDLEKLKSKN